MENEEELAKLGLESKKIEMAGQKRDESDQKLKHVMSRFGGAALIATAALVGYVSGMYYPYNGNAATVVKNPTPITAKQIPGQKKNVSGHTYTMQQGDTIYSIARKYGINPKKLQSLNGISDEQATGLRVGTIIRLPNEKTNEQGE